MSLKEKKLGKAKRDKKQNWSLLLPLFIIAGFLIRVWGIGYGLPDVYYSDEPRIVLDTLSMAHRRTLLSFDVDYPLFFKYILLSFYSFYYLIGYLFRLFKDPNDFALQFMIDPGNIFWISRFANVLLGTLTAFVAYLIGRKFYTRKVGLIAALFVLFEFQLVMHSQYAVHQIMASFTTLPVFYFYFKILDNDHLKSFFWTGAFLGIAFSAHHTAVFLVPPLLAVLGFCFFKNRKENVFRHFFDRWLILFSMTLFFSLLGNLNWIFQFDESLRFFLQAAGAARVGFASKPPFNYTVMSMFSWFLGELVRQDLILGLFLAGGIIYAVYRREKKDIVYLIFLGTYILFHYNWAYRWLHLMIGLLPIACVFGARFFNEILERVRIDKLLIPAIVLVVTPSLISLTSVNIKKSQPDTRQMARGWIERNISPGSKVGIDWSAYSVPLLGGPPVYLRNPVGRKYYEERLDNELKQRYEDYLKSKTTYDIYEVMYNTSTPIWPEEMPEEVIGQVKDRPVFIDLYSYFNFKNIEELKEDKVEYLVISSYSYTMFLLDEDPNKEFSFDPFVKDKMGDSYRQADHYINDNRHGLIYYVAKRGRDFYEPFLNETLPEAELIKEVSPGEKNLGPVVKIYKLSN